MRDVAGSAAAAGDDQPAVSGGSVADDPRRRRSPANPTAAAVGAAHVRRRRVAAGEVRAGAADHGVRAVAGGDRQRAASTDAARPPEPRCARPPRAPVSETSTMCTPAGTVNADSPTVVYVIETWRARPRARDQHGGAAAGRRRSWRDARAPAPVTARTARRRLRRQRHALARSPPAPRELRRAALARTRSLRDAEADELVADARAGRSSVTSVRHELRSWAAAGATHTRRGELRAARARASLHGVANCAAIESGRLTGVRLRSRRG